MALALRDTVTAVFAAVTAGGVTVYRGVGPKDPLTAAPYAVLYAGAIDTDGPSSDMFADTTIEVQLTCVGRSSEQVEWVADKAFNALINAKPTPPAGRAWMSPGQPVLHVLSRPVTRDDDFGAGAPMFYAVHIFALPSTPA